MNVNQQKRSQLRQKDKSYLKKIGLSKNAVRLYETALVHGPLSAKEAVSYTGSLQEAEYRLFYKLEDRQLVRRITGWPRRFEALPLHDGLQASLVQQEKQLEALVSKISLSQTANIILGRQELYRVYNTYARKAESQVSIYAIGIAYSEELAKTQAIAVKRGVNIRHVVQQVKPSNFYIIDRWQKLGIQIRQLKRSRGYHLTIIDHSYAIVTFSDPKNTDQRVSLMTSEPHIIAIFQAQFESIWRHAKPVG
jgi:sugar-specific transcriptional regulator TrmB